MLWGLMVVLPRAYAAGRRTTMTKRKTDPRGPIRQLPLYAPAAAAPRLDGVTRDTVVQLLAQLLTSVCTPSTRPEGRDETR